MEDFFKNIKNKFSADNAGTEKPNDPINGDEDIRRTLGKVEPNDIIDAEEIAAKLNEIHERSKSALEELKAESNKVIDSAKSQSSMVVDSAKSGFGILRKSQPEAEVIQEEQADVYTADGQKQTSSSIDSVEVFSQLDEIESKSRTALDDLLTKSNIIIDSAKFQSNQIIESALTNLKVIEQTRSQQRAKLAQDPYNVEDQLISLF